MAWFCEIDHLVLCFRFSTNECLLKQLILLHGLLQYSPSLRCTAVSLFFPSCNEFLSPSSTLSQQNCPSSTFTYFKRLSFLAVASVPPLACNSGLCCSLPCLLTGYCSCCSWKHVLIHFLMSFGSPMPVYQMVALCRLFSTLNRRYATYHFCNCCGRISDSLFSDGTVLRCCHYTICSFGAIICTWLAILLTWPAHDESLNWKKI